MLLDHVSASSVELFRQCKRKWFNRYIKGLKPPPTKSQEVGKEIHAAIEAYLKTGEIAEGPWKEHVEAAKEHLPAPGCLSEFEIFLEPK